MFPLWPAAELTFTFGIVVTMRNGLVLPMVTVAQVTGPEPSVDYFKATTLSGTAVSLSWGWSAADKPAKFTLARNKGNNRQPCSAAGQDDEVLPQLLARSIESEVVEISDVLAVQDQEDYVDQLADGLGPRGLCSLSAGVEYSFAILVTMANGLRLPTVRCTGWTAPRTFLHWSAAEVALWLREVVGFPEYSAAFEANGVDGAVAAVLSGEDLELDLKVSSGGSGGGGGGSSCGPWVPCY
eukprot:SAG22_NODE_514_length_9568_cov_10.711902_3_plen_240_part_00